MQVISTVSLIIQIIIGIGFVVIVHEFGHFIFARINKIKVEVFSFFGIGPPLIRIKGKETEYRISLIPIGAYVKLAGEYPSSEKPPSEGDFYAKKPFQRFQVLVAGSLFNLLAAFPLCVGMYLIGKNVLEPIVAIPGTAEAYAGIRPGDKILSVDGKRTEYLEQYLFEIIGRPQGSSARVEVEREGRRMEFEVKQMGANFHRNAPLTTKVARVVKGSAAEQAGFSSGDKIIKVNEEKVYTAYQIIRHLQRSKTEKITFEVERGGQFFVLETDVKLAGDMQEDVLKDVPPVVGEVIPGTPAEGKLMSGDQIIKVDGVAVNSWFELREAIKTKPYQKVILEIQRAGQSSQIELVPIYNEYAEGVIGITSVKPPPKESLQRDILREFGLQMMESRYHKNWGVVEAIINGIKEPINILVLTYQILCKLISAQESVRHLAGPVGIVHVTIESAKTGIGYFLWFLAIITVNLAVINLLPLPVLDGGLITLLVCEKIRGKPMSEKFLQIYLTIGWVLLMGLIIFVTFNDIQRLFRF